ncbi:MAG: metallopeptidase family protein [Patescibacteria group bacterium]|nr:metallopeptidase family protein [Patescibacteria group bacterium]
MKQKEFEELVEKGIAAIPEKFRRMMDNVIVVIADEPSEKIRREHGLSAGETLLGLYEGIPRTERGVEYGGLVMPDTITIFQRPIEDKAESVEDIPEIVANTIWHEIAHYFGMKEDEVRAEEVRRGKTK